MTLEARNEELVKIYLTKVPATTLANRYSISTRQVQRIVEKAGASRTQSQSFRLAIEQGRMVYKTVPDHLKKPKRKTILHKLRYETLFRDQFRCVLCGNTAKDCHRLEIDHIDEDPSNNSPDNLQTLCSNCNKGKSFVIRSKE